MTKFARGYRIKHNDSQQHATGVCAACGATSQIGITRVRLTDRVKHVGLCNSDVQSTAHHWELDLTSIRPTMFSCNEPTTSAAAALQVRKTPVEEQLQSTAERRSSSFQLAFLATPQEPWSRRTRWMNNPKSPDRVETTRTTNLLVKQRRFD